MALTLRHTIETDLDTYWGKVFFDEEYNRRLNRDALGFRQFEVVENGEKPDGTRIRRTKVLPKNEPPAVVKKLIGDAPSLEEGSYDPKTRRYTFKITPHAMPEKIHISGSVRAEKKGERQIERIVEVDIKVSIFGVGGVMESFIEKTFKESYDQGAIFTNKFIAEKGL